MGTLFLITSVIHHSMISFMYNWQFNKLLRLNTDMFSSSFSLTLLLSPTPVMYKEVHKYWGNFISSSIIMGEGSSDIPPPAPADGEESADIPPHNKYWKIHPLTEQCALNRSKVVWNWPKFPAYNSKHSRLTTFDKWPHGMTLSPDSLVDAGFYFTGKWWFLLFIVSSCVEMNDREHDLAA